MQVTLNIPDELIVALAPEGKEPERAALEALGLEAYRQRRLSGYQLRTLLGIPSRSDLDSFLKEHKPQFRSSSCRHYLSNQNQKAQTEKRGTFMSGANPQTSQTINVAAVARLGPTLFRE